MFLFANILKTFYSFWWVKYKVWSPLQPKKNLNLKKKFELVVGFQKVFLQKAKTTN